MMRVILRADDSMELVYGPLTIEEVEKELNAECLDTVPLAHGVVMFVDDDGIAKGLPINLNASHLRWGKYGARDDNYIHGDAYIFPDNDYAPVEQQNPFPD